MLRRPAPALAPAARLLLAGLLCGGGVWAARGKRRGRGGLGAERRVGTRGSGSGARRGVGEPEAVGARCRRPGKPGSVRPRRGTRARAVAARIWGDLQTGLRVVRSTWLGGARRLGPQPRGRCPVRVRRIGLGGTHSFGLSAYVRARSSASLSEIPNLCAAAAASSPLPASSRGP